MYIKDDYGFEDLKRVVWQGAKITVEKIDEAGKGEQLMEWLEEAYLGEVPTLTQVNDLLWHDADTVVETLLWEDEDNE